MLDDVTIVVWGEFGRTPRINANVGRDHWPDCYSVVLAGGGAASGGTFGESYRHGGYPIADAVTPADLAEKRALNQQIRALEDQRPKPLPSAAIVTDGDYRFTPDGPGDEPADKTHGDLAGRQHHAEKQVRREVHLMSLPAAPGQREPRIGVKPAVEQLEVVGEHEKRADHHQRR